MSRSWVFNQTMFRGSESPSVAPRPSAFVKLFRDISRDYPGHFDPWCFGAGIDIPELRGHRPSYSHSSHEKVLNLITLKYAVFFKKKGKRFSFIKMQET